MDKKLLVAIGVTVALGLLWSLVFMKSQRAPEALAKDPRRPAAGPAPEAKPKVEAARPVAPAANPATGSAGEARPAAVKGSVPSPTALAAVARAPLMYIARHELYEARFVDQGATLISFQMKGYETPDRQGPMDLTGEIIRDPGSRAFALEIVEDPAAQKMLYEVHDCQLQLRPETPDPKTGLAKEFVCRWSDGKRLEVVKRIHFRPGSYLLDVDVELRNLAETYLTANVALQMMAFQGPVKGGGCFSPPPDIATPTCFVGKSVERADLEDLVKKHAGRQLFDGDVHWAGVDMRYFLSAAIARSGEDAEGHEAFRKSRCEFVARAGSAVGIRLMPRRELKIPRGKVAIARFLAYLGPKHHSVLEKVNVDRAGKTEEVGLEKSVDFWILGFLCKPMLWLLNLFYGWVGNYGVAIIFLTLVVKVITFWPSQRSYRSMEGMKKLKEPMEAIRAKYANDKVRMNQEMMNLYKQHKINPLGGCLPLLIQMPIWIALYRTIYSSVEIYQQPFFGWIEDLSAKDPYFILPILLGVVMFVQQRMTPTTMDSTQAKVMLYGMPILFTAMMLFFPSGLVLYIFVNTVLSIGQQWLIRRSAATAR
jgi:YidC/Oxa1 family membrane protein insertase